MSNLPDSEMTARKGVASANEIHCLHAKLIASNWTVSPNQYPGGKDVRVTAYLCLTCRKTVRA